MGQTYLETLDQSFATLTVLAGMPHVRSYSAAAGLLKQFSWTAHLSSCPIRIVG